MKYWLVCLTLIVTSLFFFPFEFTFLPGKNTKMLLAGVGGVLFLWQGIGRKGIIVPQAVFTGSIIAGIFSLVVFCSINYNNTSDYTYVTYIVSMWVWLVAAYAVCFLINRVHGYLSVKLVVDYLIGICAVQCALALLIDNIPSLKEWVETYVLMGQETLNRQGRLYGIGASLDPSGTRFAAVLLMIGVIICKDRQVWNNKKSLCIYTCLFVWIAVVGSIIARTTSLGMVFAFVYIVYASGILKIQIKHTSLQLWSILIGIMGLLGLFCVYLYHYSPGARNLLYFGFEGFINWMETGTWSTHSTDVLKTMWVFPETLKTWIIGDGYFMDPTNIGYMYMMTDVGYLRFTFYCGLTGLSVFLSFFVYLSVACYKKFSWEKQLFILLLVLQLLVFLKVPTDLFLVYALFLWIPGIRKPNDGAVKKRSET